MKPLTLPNLPSAEVKVVLTAGKIIGLNEALQQLSIEVLNTAININLDFSIAGHPDILMNHLGGKEILLSSEQMFLFDCFAKLKLNPKCSANKIRSPYPYDSYMNSARLGKYLICNIKTASKEILKAAKIKNIEIINVNQGYAKCSICILKETAIITEDAGIKEVCEKKGIEVLLISKGSVKLSDKHYGFLGGCTGLIDKNKLAVYGNLKYHKDYKNINSFLTKHEIEPVSLMNGELTDIGGIIPIMQR